MGRPGTVLGLLFTLALALSVGVAGVVPADAATASPVSLTRKTLEGRPAPVHHVGDDPTVLAETVAAERFGHTRPAPFGVLVRDDVFADALAGAVLLGVAPLFATDSGTLTTDLGSTAGVLTPGSPVLLLGGTAALSPRVEAAVAARGFVPVRLSGDTRTETAAQIAMAALGLSELPALEAALGDRTLAALLGGDGERVLLARATPRGDDPSGVSGWVDAIAAGAYSAESGTPVLLTDSEKLSPGAARVIERTGARTMIVGGSSAVSESVAGAVRRVGAGAVDRIAGQDRYETAEQIAARLWRAASRLDAVAVDATHGSSWLPGLIAAGVSADRDAPLVLTRGDGYLSAPGCVGNLTTVQQSSGMRITAAAVWGRARSCGMALPPLPQGNFSLMFPDAVRWDFCGEMRIEANFTNAPPGARTALPAALAEIQRATGITVRYLGETSAEVTRSGLLLSRSDSAFDSESRPRPVLLAFPHHAAWSAGERGRATVSIADRQIVQGVVAIDPTYPHGEDRLTDLMLHELGHVLGLGHVEDPGQLMTAAPVAGAGRYSDGDLRGFAEMAAWGCFS